MVAQGLGWACIWGPSPWWTIPGDPCGFISCKGWSFVDCIFFNLLIIQACTVESIPISLDWIGWVKLDKHRLGVWEMWWHDNNLRLRWNRWRTRKRTWTRKRQQKFSSQSLFLPAGSRLSSLLTRWDLALILKGCAVWIKNTYESHHSGQIKRE